MSDNPDNINVSFETHEVQVVKRSYSIELTPEQAEQFEKLRDDPESQQVFLMSAVEEGTAVMQEEAVTTESEGVTQVKTDNDEAARKIAPERLRNAAEALHDEAQLEYAHTIVFNETDDKLGLGTIHSEEQVFATNYSEALQRFFDQMEAEEREVVRVYPPNLPSGEVPEWLNTSQGFARMVPVAGEENVFEINQHARVDISMPPNPDEPIGVSVCCGDEVIDRIEITPDMLVEARQEQGGPGLSPG